MKRQMTFEQAGAELDAILAELSNEDTPLERSLVLYARAAELIAYCSDTLKNAQMRVDEIDASLAAAGAQDGEQKNE